MQLWRLSQKSAEPMSQFNSEGHQAAVGPGRADDPVQHIKQENSLSLGEGSAFCSIQTFN